MKNRMYGLFIGLFLALSLALSAGMIFAGPAQPTANEILAEAPALKNEDGAINADVLSQTAAWVNDRFFLRNELIGLDRRLTAARSLFATTVLIQTAVCSLRLPGMARLCVSGGISSRCVRWGWGCTGAALPRSGRQRLHSLQSGRG